MIRRRIVAGLAVLALFVPLPALAFLPHSGAPTIAVTAAAPDPTYDIVQTGAITLAASAAPTLTVGSATKPYLFVADSYATSSNGPFTIPAGATSSLSFRITSDADATVTLAATGPAGATVSATSSGGSVLLDAATTYAVSPGTDVNPALTFSTAGDYTLTFTVTPAGGSASEFTLPVTVGAVPTTTQVSASPNPTDLGQTVTLTANLAATGAWPGAVNGTVEFTAGGSSVGSAQVTNGVATLDWSSVAAGDVAVTAAFTPPDATLAPSSGDATVVVAPATATIDGTATAQEGTDFTFTAVHTGPGPATYQWFLLLPGDPEPLPLDTTNPLVLPASLDLTGATLTVETYDSAGALLATSAPITLTVTPGQQGDTVTLDGATTAQEGGTFTFTATPTGTTPTTYRWTLTTGGTATVLPDSSDTLSLPATADLTGATLVVESLDDTGAPLATSDPVTLTVVPPGAFTVTIDGTTTAQDGTEFTFTAVSTIPADTYDWLLTIPGEPDPIPVGDGTASLVLPADVSLDGATLTVTAYDADGNPLGISEPVTLTVTPAEPALYTVVVTGNDVLGEDGMFHLLATVTPDAPGTIAWFLDIGDGPIQIGTGPTVDIPATMEVYGAMIWAVFIPDDGTAPVESEPVFLEIGGEFPGGEFPEGEFPDGEFPGEFPGEPTGPVTPPLLCQAIVNEYVTHPATLSTRIRTPQGEWTPSGVTAYVSRQVTVPTGRDYTFLGAPGSAAWQTTPTYQFGTLTVALNAQHPSLVAGARGDVTFALDKVDGPGTVSLYQVSGTSVTPILTNEKQTHTMPIGTQADVIWSFSAAGTYQVDLRTTATLTSGATSASTSRITFVVGVAPSPRVITSGHLAVGPQVVQGTATQYEIVGRKTDGSGASCRPNAAQMELARKYIAALESGSSTGTLPSTGPASDVGAGAMTALAFLLVGATLVVVSVRMRRRSV